MTLDQARKGSEIRIVSIPDGLNKSQLIRLGIAEGTVLTCHEKLPMGPVILRRRRQEIAVGRKLAEQIAIRHEMDS